jgi:hypothetical protein
VSPNHGLIPKLLGFELDTLRVKSWKSHRRDLPSARYFDGSFKSNSNRISPKFKGRSLQQIILLVFIAALTTTGVAASVSITLRGNNSNQDGVISLGVGHANTSSCDTGTTTKSDTLSQYDDTAGDFLLNQINVYNVDPNCGGKILNLVIQMDGGGDINLACNLPASNAISGLTSSQYNMATFIFSTSSTFATTATGQYYCGSSGNLIASNKLMASISATAIQIR